MKEQKFNQIVAENSELIRRICRYYNDNIHDQEDMYQEVLINIWKSLDKFRGDSKLSTYIYRIAVNVSITYASKSFKQSKLYVSADTENINEIIDGHMKMRETDTTIHTASTHYQWTALIIS